MKSLRSEAGGHTRGPLTALPVAADLELQGRITEAVI